MDHLWLIREEIEAAAAEETELPDKRLSLMFACAHPALDPGIRAPLILQTFLGIRCRHHRLRLPRLTRHHEPTPGARQEEDPRGGRPLRLPEGAELAARLDAVLEAIYAAFAEGWSDPAGTDVRRRDLAEEGIWLGRLVASLLPDEPEALGLLSLMLYAHARRDARRDAHGEYVPLAEQDPALWDTALIEEAEALLSRASALPGDRPLPARGGGAVGPCRAPSHRPRRLDGDRAHLRRPSGDDRLARRGRSIGPSRSARRAEPAAGLEALDALSDDRRLAEYQPYWAARAGLLARSVISTRPMQPMNVRSAWRAIPPCAASLNDAAGNCAGAPRDPSFREPRNLRRKKSEAIRIRSYAIHSGALDPSGARDRFPGHHCKLGRWRTSKPAFLKINPVGKVPVLVDGELVLTESIAIALYLAEKYIDRGLLPTDFGQRAQVNRWLLFAATELEQPLWRIARHTALYPETKRLAADVPLAREDFKPMAAMLEQHLRGRQFVVGNSATVADFGSPTLSTGPTRRGYSKASQNSGNTWSGWRRVHKRHRELPRR